MRASPAQSGKVMVSAVYEMDPVVWRAVRAALDPRRERTDSEVLLDHLKRIWQLHAVIEERKHNDVIIPLFPNNN